MRQKRMCTNYKKKSVQTQKEQMGRLSDHWEWQEKRYLKSILLIMDGLCTAICFIFYSFFSASFPFFHNKFWLYAILRFARCYHFCCNLLNCLSQREEKKRLWNVCAFNLSVLFVMAIQTIAFEPIKNDSTCNDMYKIIFRRAH